MKIFYISVSCARFMAGFFIGDFVISYFHIIFFIGDFVISYFHIIFEHTLII